MNAVILVLGYASHANWENLWFEITLKVFIMAVMIWPPIYLQHLTWKNFDTLSLKNYALHIFYKDYEHNYTDGN